MCDEVLINNNECYEDKIKRQIELEHFMCSEGVKRYRNNEVKSKEKSLESTTSMGRVLLQKSVVLLENKLIEFLEETNKGKAGRNFIAGKYLKDINPSVVAFITCKSIINSISDSSRLQKVASYVSKCIEDELRFKHFKSQMPNYYKSLIETLKNRSYSYQYKRSMIVSRMNDKNVAWEPWPLRDKIFLGLKLIDLFISSTGLVESVLVKDKRKKSIRYLYPTKKTIDWICGYNSRCELLSPVYLPMLIKPLEWKGQTGGGYLTNVGREQKLVNTYHHEKVGELFEEGAEEVYKAVNAIQNTSWRVNKSILRVIKYFWENNISISCLPRREEYSPPARTSNIETDDQALKDWKRKVSEVYSENVRLRSKVLQFARILWLAEKFEKEEEIYFPHEMDFRGRVYPIPNYLNPQGNDVSKSLLEFSIGKPLGNDGACYLAMHGANCWGQGIDKLSLQKRIDWSVDNSNWIVKCANDPIQNLKWCEADDPLQFLAFCFEWLGYNKEGVNYCSHGVVRFDGSQNGIQHFSAMLLDKSGAEATNIVPSNEPSDLYKEICDLVNIKIESDAQNSVEHANCWLGYVDRKLVKRPVMTLPYGAKLYGFKDQIQEEIKKRKDAGEQIPYSGDGFYECQYLAKVIHSAIVEKVSSAPKIMRWLQSITKIAVKGNLPIYWKTPCGFPVYQSYKSYNVKDVIRTQLQGKMVKLKINSPGNDMDRQKQVSGIAPNFVHSMDASAMMLTVNLSLDNDITHFAMIHDSFGTHAADARVLQTATREVFYDMYSENDVLGDFRNAVLKGLSDDKVQDIPDELTKGALDLSLVKDSHYFFA